MLFRYNRGVYEGTQVTTLGYNQGSLQEVTFVLKKMHLDFWS